MQLVQVIFLNAQRATELTDESDGMDTNRTMYLQNEKPWKMA